MSPTLIIRIQNLVQLDRLKSSAVSAARSKSSVSRRIIVLQILLLQFAVHASFFPITVVVKLAWFRLGGQLRWFHHFPVGVAGRVNPGIIDVVYAFHWFARNGA